ncbi:MAG: DUF721 domain-containing protein [Elusimicrobiota bacterium]|nr:MAG: DUF721 domain-containing protein [Elusimicrobiota bacterium]
MTEKPARWSTSGDLIKSFSYRANTVNDKLALLSAVWDKECGAFAKHWALVAVKKGVLFVRPKSAAAAQELQLRSGPLLKALNKYFSRPWLTAVKTTYR